MRIQRLRFCSQAWNWSRSSLFASGVRDGRAGALFAVPKNSSYDTPPGAAPAPPAGTAGGAGVDSSPNTELSERLSWAGRVGAPVAAASVTPRSGPAGGGAGAATGGRAPRTPRRKV